MTQASSGVEILLEVLHTEGVRHIFGNPGTTELPLMDALAGDDRFRYVLGLHESVAAGMADGYAQITGRPSFLNVHTATGLGNAMGNLSNSRATRTPIVVTAGQQDRRHLLAQPFLSGDLVDMGQGVGKWTHEVHRTADLATIMRRAFHDAASPPTGPVFVSLPMDVLTEHGTFDVPHASRVERRTVPDGLGDLAAAVLAAPRGRFAIVASDEVATTGATAELVAVSERLGSAVFGAPMHSNQVFPSAHPLWAGALPADALAMRDALASYQVVLLIGSRGFMTFAYRDAWPLPDDLQLLHLSPAPGDLGRIYPTAMGLVGDPKATLAALLPLLCDVDAAEVDRLASEITERGCRRAEQLATQVAATAPDHDGRMHPLAAVSALLSALPSDTMVVDEAVTSDPYIRALHRTTAPDRFLYSRGGGLGWGLPAALGVSLARDREPTVAVVGDGSFLFCPQALWTARREGLPVVAVVLNNRGYLILRRFVAQMRGTSASEGDYVGLDIAGPDVDLLAIAKGFGVQGVRVEQPSDVGAAVRGALEAGGPALIEVTVSAPPVG